MLKLNRKTTVFLTFAGSVFSLIALLIFMFLPTSDFANSIDRPAKDALMVMAVSPVLAFLGAVSFNFAVIKDFKAWVSFIECKPLVIGLTSLSAVLSLFNIGLFAAYSAELFSLGFVASYSGTIYETLTVIATVLVALKIVFSVIITIAAIRNK